ncbi:hypothetical protein CEXT_509281 [Caerostris extrusa]|uniref:Uncharacterized protein n=1 Tax=Caerostris extrusa TaxID=172846 RepID=A0AAV4WUK0_CAEEX|nr:hypothetical protein CEXT_509281 [Caerostris extrusa]
MFRTMWVGEWIDGGMDGRMDGWKILCSLSGKRSIREEGEVDEGNRNSRVATSKGLDSRNVSRRKMTPHRSRLKKYFISEKMQKQDNFHYAVCQFNFDMAFKKGQCGVEEFKFSQSGKRRMLSVV